MRAAFCTVIGATVTFVAVAVLSVYAQQPSTGSPTKDDPIRFTAFAVQMQGGRAGRVEIAIERWTTPEERQALVAVVHKATDAPGGQDDLLDALQHVKPRTGYIRTSNSIGWDLKYAYQFVLPDGGRQIVIVTDKPVSFAAAATSARTMDYPFTLVEMRFPAGSDKGEGKLLSQTSISTENGKLQLELYGQEPTRLTTITEERAKGSR